MPTAPRRASRAPLLAALSVALLVALPLAGCGDPDEVRPAVETDMGAPDLIEAPDLPDPPDPPDLGPRPERCPYGRTTDADRDGVLDCDEWASQCMLVDRPDSDGDGLTDLQELQLSTDPCLSDTDEDGLDDAREHELELDPRSPETFPPTRDGALFITRACSENTSQPVMLHADTRGDWSVAVAPSVDYQPLQLDHPALGDAAATLDARTHEVAGLVMALDTSVHTQRTLAQRARAVYDAFAQAPDATIVQHAQRTMTTHDFFSAARVWLTVEVTPQTSGAMRDALLTHITPYPLDSVSGLPAHEGSAHARFSIAITLVERADRVLITAAVAPVLDGGVREDARRVLEDLTNTTGLTRAYARLNESCEELPVRVDQARADLYWVLDPSASMRTHYATMLQFAQSFHEGLQSMGVDFRLGVTNTTWLNEGRLRQGALWHRELDTFRREIQEFVIDCNGCVRTHEEWGLWVAQKGITAMATPGQTPEAAIRHDALLATIIMSDERPESLKLGATPDGLTGTPEVLLRSFKRFFQGLSRVYAVVSPDAVCGEEDAREYGEVALSTGGLSVSLCAEDLQESIETITESIAGTSSPFRLAHVPVSATLRVYQSDPDDPTKGRWVPRSRQGGFDYFPQTNSIAFFGEQYQPDTSGAKPVQIAISYARLVPESKQN